MTQFTRGGEPMKAIETEYAGVLFRSRTEARWAVFFDALGVRWRYEHEGYELAHGRYLPDFWLPDLKTWVEIKGQAPTDNEWELCSELATATGHRAVLFVGSPLDLPESWEFKGPGADSGYLLLGAIRTPSGEVAYIGSDNQQWPCICIGCGRVGIEFNGRAERVCGEGACFEGRAYSHDHPRILEALSVVRAHRFWNPRREA